MTTAVDDPVVSAAVKGPSLLAIAIAKLVASTAPVRSHRWFTSIVTILACGLIAAVDLYYRFAHEAFAPAAPTSIAAPPYVVPAPMATASPPVAAPPVPDLAGIVGRLPDDGVAMIRQPDGRTKLLRVGETASGWTLEDLSSAHALFSRQGREVVVDLDLPPDE